MAHKLFFFFFLSMAWYSHAQLTCPKLIVPLNNSTNSPATTLVQWTQIPTAIGYEVTMGTSPFENDILEKKIFEYNQTEQMDFPPNSTIYVVIIPFSNTQFAVGCEQFSFETTAECAHFINPIADVLYCKKENGELGSVIVDFEKLEKEFIEDQEDLIITYHDAEGNLVDVATLTPNFVTGQFSIWIRATDVFECFKETSFILIAIEPPILDMAADVTVCERYMLPPLNSDNYYFTGENGTGTEIEAGQLITTDQSIFIRTAESSCPEETSFMVRIDPTICEEFVTTIEYPSFFTPNGDGVNDVWQLTDSLGIRASSPIYIYDRNGKLISQLFINAQGWDGNYKGSQLPASDYWFSVALENNNILKGHFTLKR